MEITRDVILDLLPLYLADEASADTRVLVERYLETDPELADMAKKSEAAKLPGNVPVPLTEEDKMGDFKEAKRLMFERTLALAAIISFSFIALLALVILTLFFFKG
ncbi:MAG: hypothetical protein JXB45_12215 [Candidatus Krumholzibacteriota bacterium]|nr:hypothetical protein [Candidatus Krumholzibacteriota bacterium]